MSDEASDKDIAQRVPKEDRTDTERVFREYQVVGNSSVVSNALEELNRVDLTELSDSQLRAYSETLGDMSWLRESLDENSYEVTDD